MQEIRVQTLGWEDPWWRYGNPVQYYCLKNPMNRGAWQATAYGLTELDTTQATERDNCMN